MSKYLVGLSLMLMTALGVMVLLYVKRGAEIMRLEGLNNARKGNIVFLEKELEERNKRALETNQRLQQIEAAAAEDKAFDWHTDISASPVIKRLQAN